MSDDTVAEKAREVPDQKLWPIFLVGFALAAFGFYFVFAEGAGDMAASPSVAAPHEPPALGSLDGSIDAPVTLVYDRGPRRLAVQLEQRSERPSKKNIRTTLRFDLVDEPVEPGDGEAFAYLRSFEDAAVALRSGDEVIGTDVTNEVVRLLEATQLEVGFDQNGQRVRVEVVSSESAQLRPTLDLIKDATRFVLPPMPSEPVNADEEWSIRMVAEVDGTDILEVEGHTEVAFELTGGDAEMVKLDAVLSGDVRATWDDSEARRGHLETVISGSGAYHWTREPGGVSAVDLTIERRVLEPDGEELESATIRVSARAL